ncbi:MAG: hypothetical protein ABWY06_09450 [Pseudomonas sp.]|uniref:hypothetical protein n=1 Tax=Pseudomonas sp. TaxID=306 RepID=UPI00339425E0
MHGLLRAAICATLLHSPATPQATTVMRCEDASGHITFTLHGCSTDQQGALQKADNHSPGSGKPVPMAKPLRPRGSAARNRAGTVQKPEVVGVGTQDDGCGNRITSSERRQAMIRKEVRAGMPLKDVESMLGKPNGISSQNGQMRYQYVEQNGRRRTVSFDETGCVKGKR